MYAMHQRATAAVGLRGVAAGTLLLARRLSSTTVPPTPMPPRTSSSGSGKGDVEAATSDDSRALLHAMLSAKSKQLADLRAIEQECHIQAHRYPDRYMFGCFAFLVVQAVVLFDWTYIHFDWNLVEPITYLVGYAGTWIALAWYGNMQEEFGYDSLREMIEMKKMKELCKQKNLDVGEVKRLQVEVERLKRMTLGAADRDDNL